MAEWQNEKAVQLKIKTHNFNWLLQLSWKTWIYEEAKKQLRTSVWKHPQSWALCVCLSTRCWWTRCTPPQHGSRELWHETLFPDGSPPTMHHVSPAHLKQIHLHHAHHRHINTPSCFSSILALLAGLLMLPNLAQLNHFLSKMYLFVYYYCLYSQSVFLSAETLWPKNWNKYFKNLTTCVLWCQLMVTWRG